MEECEFARGYGEECEESEAEEVDPVVDPDPAPVKAKLEDNPDT